MAGFFGHATIWQIVAQASVVVQAVLALLAVASFVSWALIFAKMRAFFRAKREDARFLADFASADGLSSLVQEAKEKYRHGPLAASFTAAMQEYLQQMKHQVDGALALEAARRAAEAAAAAHFAQLSQGLVTLAAISSSAPFVGLFGTVWGIMETFRNIAQVQSASLATVAPGIADALIATAMGLFAAVPAVFTYNRFVAALADREAEAERFRAQLLNLLSRHQGR